MSNIGELRQAFYESADAFEPVVELMDQNRQEAETAYAQGQSITEAAKQLSEQMESLSRGENSVTGWARSIQHTRVSLTASSTLHPELEAKARAAEARAKVATEQVDELQTAARGLADRLYELSKGYSTMAAHSQDIANKTRKLQDDIKQRADEL